MQPPHPAPRYNHTPAEKDWPPWAERPRPWAGQGRAGQGRAGVKQEGRRNRGISTAGLRKCFLING